MASKNITNAHFLSGKKIAVAGGGFAGLAFGLALGKQWLTYTTAPPPQVTIYERDGDEKALGRGGYSIGFRGDEPGGLQALQKLGCLEEMIRIATMVADENNPVGFRIWDHNMNAVLQLEKSTCPPGLPVSNLRVTRDNVRKTLLEGTKKLDNCEMKWDSVCSGVRRLPNGRLEIKFQNGTTDTCDLLIAADGAGSKVRTQLRPNDKPTFRGLSIMFGTARFEGPHPLGKQIGMMKGTDAGGIFMGPVDDHSVIWAMSRGQNGPITPKRQPMSDSEKAELMTIAQTEAKKFAPFFQNLVDATDDSTLALINTQDKEPFAHTDEEFPDVIFIGDANHAVTPFAGNGANMAVCDGWDLAELLCKSNSTPEAVKQYDEVVVPRSTKVWKSSHWNIWVFSSSGWLSTFFLGIIRVLNFIFLRNKGMEHKKPA